MSEVQAQIQRHVETLVETGASCYGDPGSPRAITPTPLGYVAGELARRATSRPIGELLREWITAPLGIDGQVRLVPSFDTAMSVNTILADYLTGAR